MRQTLFSISLIASVILLSSFGLSQLEEYGKAGYYADSLHGRKTASGEKYDKTDLTCAHKSLPFGTKVRVTRIDNQKSVVVRVNDRGPFVDGYVTDISRAAAEKIGLIRDGVTRVKLEVVQAAGTGRVAAETDGNTRLLMARASGTAKGDAQSSKSIKAIAYSTDPAPQALRNTKTELFKVDLKSTEKDGYGVQVTTLYDANNVIPELKKLQAAWPGKSLVLVEKSGNDETAVYKLIIGPYPDKKSAENQRKIAAKKSYKGCFVVDLYGM